MIERHRRRQDQRSAHRNGGEAADVECAGGIGAAAEEGGSETGGEEGSSTCGSVAEDHQQSSGAAHRISTYAESLRTVLFYFAFFSKVGKRDIPEF